MRDVRLSALRETATGAKRAGTPIPVDPTELLVLLDSHDAALELAMAVAAFQSIEVAGAGSSGSASASEIRSRLRRSVEERTLRLNAALARFRAVVEGKR